jgi:hypothetical protein
MAKANNLLKISVIFLSIVALTACYNKQPIERKLINELCSNLYTFFNEYKTNVSIINNLQDNTSFVQIKDVMISLAEQEKSTLQFIGNFLTANSDDMNRTSTLTTPS